MGTQRLLVTGRDAQGAAVAATLDVPVDFLIVGAAELAALPTAGTPWSRMLAVADSSWPSVKLDDQDNQVAAKAVAAGLVYARTGTASYRTKVVSVLNQVRATQASNQSKALSWGRQVGGYVIAADLVGYRDPGFVAWVDQARTVTLPEHGRWKSIQGTMRTTYGNWGAWCTAAYLAASRYVGDQAGVDTAIRVLKGYLGDRAAWGDEIAATAGYDPAWSCAATPPTEYRGPGINPACTPVLDGAVVEDVARSATEAPLVDDTGRMYSWENLAGYLLAARLARRAGFTDVYDYQDAAFRRAAQFLSRNGGWPPQYTVSYSTAVTLTRVYGVDFGPLPGYNHDRCFGYTDWLTP